MSWIVITFVVGYIACGVVAYGAVLADFQTEFPGMGRVEYRRDVALATAVSCIGPVGLLIAVFLTGFMVHGLQYRRKEPK